MANNNINVGFLLNKSAFFINTSNDTYTSNQFYIINSNIIIGNSNYPTSNTRSNSIVNLYGSIFVNNVPLGNVSGSGSGGGFTNGQSITTGTISTQNSSINIGSGTITSGNILSTNALISNNLITSNLIVLGSNTTINSIITSTSNFTISNVGGGTALRVYQNSLLAPAIFQVYDVDYSYTIPTFEVVDAGPENTNGYIRMHGSNFVDFFLNTTTSIINTQNNAINAGSGGLKSGTITSDAITCGLINTQNNAINAGTATITASTFSGNATTATTAGSTTTVTAGGTIVTGGITSTTITTQNNTINAGTGTINSGILYVSSNVQIGIGSAAAIGSPSVLFLPTRALSTNNTTTVPQTLIRLGWQEGVQDLGTGEGCAVTFSSSLVGDAGTYYDAARIASFKEGNSDTDRTSALTFLTSVDGGVTAPVERMRISAAGNLGIGVTAPTTYNLQVSGTIGATADISAFTSDERLKTKTGTLSGALDKICTLETFTYTHNDLARSFGFTDNRQYVGISAQQIQKVLPETVRRAPFDSDTINGIEQSKSGQDYLTVQYERIVPLLIEALKEERSARESLEARIKFLEEK